MAVHSERLGDRELPWRLQPLSFAWPRRIERGDTGGSREPWPIWVTCWRTNDCEYSQPYGIKPAPERNRKTNWKEFLNRQWEQIVASDFFTVEVWTPKGLKRYIVLFCIELSTRRVDSGRNLEYGE